MNTALWVCSVANNFVRCSRRWSVLNVQWLCTHVTSSASFEHRGKNKAAQQLKTGLSDRSDCQ